MWWWQRRPFPALRPDTGALPVSGPAPASVAGGTAARPGEVKALFFAYFSLVGAMSPYLGLYFAAWGLSIAQISLLLAVPQLMRVVAPPFWGAWSDRVTHRVRLLPVSAFGTLAAIVLMALAQGNAAVLLGLVSVLYFFTAAQGPIAESLALGAARGDSGAYGRMRQWGSIGFIVAVVAAGPLLDWLGARWLILPMAVLAVGLVAVSWWAARSAQLGMRAPVVPGPAGAHTETQSLKTARSVWRRLREPKLAAFFLANALMIFAHAALYAFFSLYLDRHGYSKSWIGAIWSLGVVVEILLFRWQHHLFNRFGALSLLGFSLATAAVRFALIGWGEGHWAIVLVSQLLHAITFGVHHSGAMVLLHRWFAPGEQGRAQALYATLAYGVGGSAGGLAAGWCWENASPAWAFYCAALAALVGCGAVVACQRFEYAETRGSADLS